MTSLQVRIDRTLCLGTGVCEATEPEHFQLDEDLKSTWSREAGELPLERLARVVRLCPQGAISVYDGDTPVIQP